MKLYIGDSIDTKPVMDVLVSIAGTLGFDTGSDSALAMVFMDKTLPVFTSIQVMGFFHASEQLIDLRPIVHAVDNQNAIATVDVVKFLAVHNEAVFDDRYVVIRRALISLPLRS